MRLPDALSHLCLPMVTQLHFDLMATFGDSPHELAVHNLGNFSITVFCAGGVAPSVFHLIRGTGPKNWEIFKKCFKTAEINNTVAIAQFLRNPPPFMRPRLGRSDACFMGYRTIIARYVAKLGIAQMFLCKSTKRGVSALKRTARYGVSQG